MRRPSRPEVKIPGNDDAEPGQDSGRGFAPPRVARPKRIIRRRNRATRCATISGSVLSMSAPTTSPGTIMRGFRAPRSKPKYGAPRHGSGQAGNSPPANRSRRCSTTRWVCLISIPRHHHGDPRLRQLSPEERRAWKTMRMEPVDDLDKVKAQYKQLAKEHHPDMNGGDAGAEERLKEINLAYDLIRKSLQSTAAPTIS